MLCLLEPALMDTGGLQMRRCEYLQIGFKEDGSVELKCTGEAADCVKLYSECVVSEICWNGPNPSVR